MADHSENFYAGADYGLEPRYSDEYSLDFAPAYRFSTAQFGVPTDPRTANQLDALSKKLSTGAKTIEVSGVMPATFETVPEQHLKEIERLKKLAGVDLTFHGPLVEPTGARRGWNESHREQAERQMWQAVERAHKLEPSGNLVVTFHSSTAIPEPETKVVNEKTGREEIKEFWIVDENSGDFRPAPFKPDYFRAKEYKDVKSQEQAIKELVEKQNKESWFRQLQQVNFHANQGAGIVAEALASGKVAEGEALAPEALKAYGKYLEGKGPVEELKKLGKPYEKISELAEKGLMNKLTHGDIYLRDAYQELQNLFNQAYESALRNNDKSTLEKLESFRNEIKSKLDYIEEPEKMTEFGDTILKGVSLLRKIKAPQLYKPLREFAIEKASETFSNITLNAYKKFKESAPIISIENPPAGSGLTRAQDLRELVDASRKKLKEKLIKEVHLSPKDAELQAKKLIGVTWDVGHINMLRKFGYGEKSLVQETEKIAPYVKHVHLSDNFGMEHTELPMGMGNVPVKPMLEAIEKYNKKVKRIIETGNWFGPQAFGSRTPLAETLRSFGSPIYAMKMAPYWNQAYASSGGYFSGYGRVFPEQHFSMYGSGFSNLPVELGGQMAGRSRVSGAPIS